MIKYENTEFVNAKVIDYLQIKKNKSVCKLLCSKKKYYVSKLIGNEYFNLKSKIIFRIEKKIKLYHKSLKKLNIETQKYLKIFRITIENEQKIVLISDYCGVNLEKYLKDKTKVEYLTITRQILTEIAKVIDVSEIRISLDPKLKNFCIKHSKLCYVDLFPPLIKEDISGINVWDVKKYTEREQSDKIRDCRYFRSEGLLMILITDLLINRLKDRMGVVKCVSKQLEFIFSKSKNKTNITLILKILNHYIFNELNRSIIKNIIKDAGPKDRDLLKLLLVLTNRSCNKNFYLKIFEKYKSPVKYPLLKKDLLQSIYI